MGINPAYIHQYRQKLPHHSWSIHLRYLRQRPGTLHQLHSRRKDIQRTAAKEVQHMPLGAPRVGPVTKMVNDYGKQENIAIICYNSSAFMFNNHSKPGIDERKSSWTHMELFSPGAMWNARPLEGGFPQEKDLNIPQRWAPSIYQVLPLFEPSWTSLVAMKNLVIFNEIIWYPLAN